MRAVERGIRKKGILLLVVILVKNVLQQTPLMLLRSKQIQVVYHISCKLRKWMWKTTTTRAALGRTSPFGRKIHSSENYQSIL